MHLPDGFLSHGAATGLIGAAALAAGLALRQVRKTLLEKVPVLRRKLATFPNSDGGADVNFHSRLSNAGQEKISRMAAVGSLIFAVQMVNFPIGGGTSGHLLGGVLAAIILGPAEAMVVITVMLTVQAFLFGDGGVWALGANIFNMGVVGALGGYAFFRFLMKGAVQRRGFLGSVFTAAWVSVILASIGASAEIAVSGTKALSVVLPAMTLTHTIIGFAEGFITVVIVSWLLKKGYALAVFERSTTYEA